ncbi:MAG: hypothetical protein PHT33_05210 [bacterium]|nr:hypothetical protein [bacterium]
MTNLAFFDQAQRLGMTIMPDASYGVSSWNRWWQGCPNTVLTDAVVRQDEADAQAFHTVFSESPRVMAVYLADEPNPGWHPWDKCSVCTAALKNKFGYDKVPGPQDKGYYDAVNFIKERQVFTLGRGIDLFKRYNPDVPTGAIFSLYASLYASYDGTGLANRISFPGVDHYRFGNDPFALDTLRSAADFQDDIWLTATTSILYNNRYHPEYAATQVYNALCHNAKGMSWWIWKAGPYDMLEDPARTECMKTAFKELAVAGPLFKRLSRSRARVALFNPTTTMMLAGKTGRQKSDFVSSVHDLARQAFGQVDILHEEQIRHNRFLPDYSVLILAGAAFLPDDVVKAIGNWVASGGILIVLPETGTYNQYRDKSDSLASVLGASCGEELTAMVNGGSDMPVKGYIVVPGKAVPVMSYAGGQSAVAVNTYGKGNAICLGFVPGRPSDLVALVAGTNTGPVSCSNTRVDVGHFVNLDSVCIVAVNQGLKEQAAEINTEWAAASCYAYDLLTGERLPAAIHNGRVTANVGLKSLWGKILVLLPSQPARLQLKVLKDVSSRRISYEIVLLDSRGKSVNALLPVQITITDSEGREREEYGGVRVLDGGRLKVDIPLADNDPEGSWKIQVTEKLSGQRAEARF